MCQAQAESSGSSSIRWAVTTLAEAAGRCACMTPVATELPGSVIAYSPSQPLAHDVGVDDCHHRQVDDPTSFRLADGVKLVLQAEFVEFVKWQVDEDVDPVQQKVEGRGKCLSFLFIRAFNQRRIRQPPMRRHRLAGPYRADFVGGVVADSKYKIQPGRAGRRKLIPALAAQPIDRQAGAPELFKRQRIGAAGGMAAGTKSPELPPIHGKAVEDGLAHDAARRVVRAEKQYIENAFFFHSVNTIGAV